MSAHDPIIADVNPAEVKEIRAGLREFRGTGLPEGHPEGALRVAQNIVTRRHPEDIQYIRPLLDLTQSSDYDHLGFGEVRDHDRLPTDADDLRRRRDALLRYRHGLRIGYHAVKEDNYFEEMTPLIGIVAAVSEEHDHVVDKLALVTGSGR